MTTQLVLSAAIILVTMVVLDWFESRRSPIAPPARPEEEDSMKSLLAAIIGLAIVAFTDPAAAYMVEITTSIPVASAVDDAQLKEALESAIDDVLHHAIAFTPTVVELQTARVVGDRIYILLLIADGEGEEMMKKLSAED